MPAKLRRTCAEPGCGATFIGTASRCDDCRAVPSTQDAERRLALRHAVYRALDDVPEFREALAALWREEQRLAEEERRAAVAAGRRRTVLRATVHAPASPEVVAFAAFWGLPVRDVLSSLRQAAAARRAPAKRAPRPGARRLEDAPRLVVAMRGMTADGGRAPGKRAPRRGAEEPGGDGAGDERKALHAGDAGRIALTVALRVCGWSWRAIAREIARETARNEAEAERLTPGSSADVGLRKAAVEWARLLGLRVSHRKTSQ